MNISQLQHPTSITVKMVSPGQFLYQYDEKVGLLFNCTFSWLSFSVCSLVCEWRQNWHYWQDSYQRVADIGWSSPECLSTACTFVTLASLFISFPPTLHQNYFTLDMKRVKLATSFCILCSEPGYLELDHVKDQHILAHFNMIKAAVKPFRSTTFTQSLYWVSTTPAQWLLAQSPDGRWSG